MTTFPPHHGTLIAGKLGTGRGALEGALADGAHLLLLVGVEVDRHALLGGDGGVVFTGGDTSHVPRPAGHGVYALDADSELGRCGGGFGRCFRRRPVGGIPRVPGVRSGLGIASALGRWFATRRRR